MNDSDLARAILDDARDKLSAAVGEWTASGRSALTLVLFVIHASAREAVKMLRGEGKDLARVLDHPTAFAVMPMTVDAACAFFKNDARFASLREVRDDHRPVVIFSSTRISVFWVHFDQPNGQN